MRTGFFSERVMAEDYESRAHNSVFYSQPSGETLDKSGLT